MRSGGVRCVVLSQLRILPFRLPSQERKKLQKKRNASRKEREALRERIFATDTHDEVLDILARNGLSRYVEDYNAYLRWRREGLEEGESPGIILQSLQSWAWFLISYAEPTSLPYTMIDADHDGCIELEWRLSPDADENDPDDAYWGNGHGIAVLRFYPSYLNSLSVLSGPYASGKRRLAFEGCLSHVKTQKAIDMFAERFMDDEE